MPRPEYIARLHGAFYDLRTCDPEQRPEMLRRYREALADYPVWVKQERLPRIDRR